MTADTFIRLHIVNGIVVNVYLTEWAGGGGGTPNFGEADHVIERAMKRGFFVVNGHNNQATGLNGGVGEINYPVANIFKIEVLSKKLEETKGTIG